MPFTATWMDIEMITVREISWAEKDKYHDICGILKKKKRFKRPYLQNRNRLTDTQNKLIITKREKGKER